MKKIISIIICISICFGLLPVYAKTNTENQDKYTDIVSSLGLMDPMEGNTLITRAQAVYIAANLLYIGNIPKSSDSPYTDVPDVYWAADAVSVMKKNHYLNQSKMFYPDKAMSINDAAELLTGILGYRDAINEGLDIDLGRMSREIGILDGVNSTALTAEVMAQLVLNAIEEPMFMSNYSISSPGYAPNRSYTLAKLLNIEIYTGVLLATSSTSMGASLAPEGCINVGTKTYYSALDIDRYLGAEATIYAVKYNSDKYHTAVYADFSDLKWLEIAAEDIVTVSSTSITYYEYNKLDRKLKTASLSSGIPVCYNGKKITTPDITPYIQPELGSVYLVDNGTGYISAFVLDYEPRVIAYVSSTQNTIVCSSVSANEVIDTNLYDKVEIYRDGKKISFDRLYPNDVIHLCASADGSLLRIYTETDGLVCGTLNSVSDTYVVIDDKEYNYYSDIFTSEKYGEISIGESADYYIDLNGFIFAYTKDKYFDDVYYGYLYGASVGQVFEKSKIKVFDELGSIHIYELSDKVRYTDGITDTRLDAAALINTYLKDGSGNTKDMLIRYRLNADNKVISINLSKTLSGDEAAQGYSSDFSVVLKDDPGSNTYMTFDVNNVGRFNNKYIPAEDALVFYIPYDLDETKMMISNISQIFGGIRDNKTTRTVGAVTLYNSDEFLNVDIVVCKATAAMMPNSSGSPAVVYASAKATNANGEDLTKVYYYMDGVQGSVFVDGDVPQGTFVPGVMAQFSIDKNGKASNYRILYNPNENTGGFLKSVSATETRYNNQAYLNSACLIFGGYAYARDADATRMVINTGLDWDEMRSININGASYYIYDTQRKKLSRAVSSDLTSSKDNPQYIVFRGASTRVKELIIIK